MKDPLIYISICVESLERRLRCIYNSKPDHWPGLSTPPYSDLSGKALMCVGVKVCPIRGNIHEVVI